MVCMATRLRLLTTSGWDEPLGSTEYMVPVLNASTIQKISILERLAAATPLQL